MKKKIIPFTIGSALIATTIPLLSACGNNREEKQFSPSMVSWSSKDGEYKYPIVPLSEQQVQSKDELTQLYLANSYENSQIVANDILQSFYSSVMEQYTSPLGNIYVYVSDIDLTNKTISYTTYSYINIETSSITIMMQMIFRNMPSWIIQTASEGRTYAELTVPSLEPDFWSNKDNWESEFNAITTQGGLAPHFYFNHKNCVVDGELDQNFKLSLLNSFGASNIKYLENVKIDTKTRI